MSGIEIVVLVGGAIYISKKVKENRAKKRLAKEAALRAEHGEAQITDLGTGTGIGTRTGPAQQQPRYRQQVPIEDEEGLPMYTAPTEKPPTSAADTHTQGTYGMLPPAYNELPESQRQGAKAIEAGVDTSFGRDDGHASSSTPAPSYLSPTPDVKKHRRFFSRSSRSKTDVQQEQ